MEAYWLETYSRYQDQSGRLLIILSSSWDFKKEGSQLDIVTYDILNVQEEKAKKFPANDIHELVKLGKLKRVR